MADKWWEDLPIFTRPGFQLVKDSPDYVRTPAQRQARRESGVAGSYNHIINKKGDLLDNEKFVGMIENLGDAYEMTEELFGMIWWLAHNAPKVEPPMAPADLVEWARQQYREGLVLARATDKKKRR